MKIPFVFFQTPVSEVIPEPCASGEGVTAGCLSEGSVQRNLSFKQLSCLFSHSPYFPLLLLGYLLPRAEAALSQLST